MADISGMDTTSAVAASASTQFVATGAFYVLCDNVSGDEFIRLWRLGPSGDYFKATNKDGEITLGAYPNMIYVDVQGTFRVEKTATISDEVAVSWEEV